MAKLCKWCDLIKPIEEFYKHSRMADGHLNKCKSCVKAYVIAHRIRNVDKIREYDRKRYKENPARRERMKKRVKALDEEYPERYRARYTVANAVRDGRLKKEPCEICGRTDHIHGHHDDYDKPLDVRWLCPVHHSEAHRS